MRALFPQLFVVQQEQQEKPKEANDEHPADNTKPDGQDRSPAGEDDPYDIFEL